MSNEAWRKINKSNVILVERGRPGDVVLLGRHNHHVVGRRQVRPLQLLGQLRRLHPRNRQGRSADEHLDAGPLHIQLHDGGENFFKELKLIHLT